jgi:hypothetical protein
MLREMDRWKERAEQTIFGAVDRFGAQSRGERLGLGAVSAATGPLIE